MTIRKAGKNIVISDETNHIYKIGFNEIDETELDASNMDELEELWISLCPEFECEPDSIDYVERVW